MRNSFTPAEVDVVQVVQPAFFHGKRDVRALPGLFGLMSGMRQPLPPTSRMI